MKHCLIATLLAFVGLNAWAERDSSHELWGHDIDRPMLNGKMFDASMESASFVCTTLVPGYIYAEIVSSEPFKMNDMGLNAVDEINTSIGAKFFVNHWDGIDQTPALTGVRCYVSRS